MEKQPFWMVYGIGQGDPVCRHKQSFTAFAEAERLAKKCPGAEFVVLEAIGYFVKRDIDKVLLRPAIDDPDPFDDGIPF